MLNTLPVNARLVTLDAVGMYNNIDTSLAIESLQNWFTLHKDDLPKAFPVEFILKGTEFVMSHNIFDFDDISCLQLNGTAMGTALAVMYATIYFSYHEETRLLNSEVDHGIIFYRRYIDDAFAIQIQHPGYHARLLNDFNSYGPPDKRLVWESSGPSTEVNFLDLRLRIQNGKILSSTYEKPLNLHLYIPSHSAHAHSVHKSLIFGQLRRFWLQNSTIEDYTKQASAFFKHLIARGYDWNFLSQQFLKTAEKLPECSFVSKPKANDKVRNTIFLHKKYHPQQVTGRDIQLAFAKECGKAFKTSYHEVYEDSPPLGINRLIIAHSRAPNLRDKLCRAAITLPDNNRASDRIRLLRE
jgi:hypothetical protein